MWMTADRHQRHQQLFARAHQPGKRRRGAFERSASRRRTDRRYVHELHQRPAVARTLQSTPISVIAKVVPGIARQKRGQCGSTQRGEQARERRLSCERSFRRFDGCSLRAPAADIGQQDRTRIARAGLDANLSPPAGEAENQEYVRLARQQFGQITVDRVIGRGKDVGGDIDPSERRPAPACQRGGQLFAWVRWRARERTEACNHDSHNACLFAHDLFPLFGIMHAVSAP